VDRQVGAVFLVNGKVVGMDAFGKAATFSQVFKNLLESYAMDAVDRFEKETDADTGKKAASDVLVAASAAKPESRPSVSLDKDLRIESDELIGFALEHDGHVVQFCLFAGPGSREGNKSTRYVRSSSRRRGKGVLGLLVIIID
jgi:hypothetical protein